MAHTGAGVAALAGCGRATPPGTLVGESAHFRLFVDPEAEVPAGFEGMNGLAALEATVGRSQGVYDEKLAKPADGGPRGLTPF